MFGAWAERFASTQNQCLVSVDLREFLCAHGLEHYSVGLFKLGITDLSDLEEIARSEEMAKSETGQTLYNRQTSRIKKQIAPRDLPLKLGLLPLEEAVLFSTDVIKRFRKRMEIQAQQVLVRGQVVDQHLLFLTHFKVEAGTEAALMRTEIEAILRETEDHIAKDFNVPVFLDSEDLNNLSDLQERVRRTHFVVALLTQDVLTRPWCIVEIVTARASNVPVLLVSIDKSGFNFTYPDEAFYKRLRDGEIIDPAGIEVLSECGIDLHDVEGALKRVFKHIAIPFSPHKAGRIRRAELQALLKLCKETPGRRDSAFETYPM